MVDDPRAITYIGSTDFRNSNVEFGIRAKDRLRHTYIIGSTGVGKSFLIENMIIQDLQNGNGIALLDPHGSTAEKMLKYIPEHRINDVIYFAPHDLEYPIGFNPLEDPGPDFRSQVSDGLLTAFKRIWVDAFSARMEYVLSNTLLALLEYPDATLLSVNRMLADKKFREKVVANVRDPSVKSVWVDEFMKWEDKFAREAFSAIQNKVGQFTANPMIRNILGQPKSTLDFRDMMDTRKIFIANLSKGRVGEQNAPLIGAMLITKIYLAAMSRADKSEYDMNFLPPFYLYVDEFQNFANDSFENILSESRKYKLGLIVAHQYISQMPETIQNAVFGNVGTKIIFRTQKPEDAEVFEKVFTPVFTQSDIMNLGLAQIYLTLLIDGVGSAPFSARTIRQKPTPAITFENEAITASRARYTRPRAEVEEEISKWFLSGTPVATQNSQQASGTAGGNSSSQHFVSPVRASVNTVVHEESKNAITRKRDEEHAAFLDQKRKEIEDRGGVWLSPDEYKAAKEAGSLDQVMREKRAELAARKRKEQNNFEQKEQAEKSFGNRDTRRNNNSTDGDGRGNAQRPERRRTDDLTERGPQREDNRKNRQDEIVDHTRGYDTVSRPPLRQADSVVAPKKNEANDDTRGSLKAMLSSLKQSSAQGEDSIRSASNEGDNRQNIKRSDSEQRNHHNGQQQKSNISTERQKNSDDRNLPNKSERHEHREYDRLQGRETPDKSNNQSDLTSGNQSAVYAHADTNTPAQTNHVPGWNEISPADLARALGTTL